MEIKGSVAIITGAGNGIGEAVAKYFVRNGAKVVIVDMMQKNIDRVVKDIKDMGGEVIGVQANVSSEAETAKFIKAAIDAFGKINVVVASAGIIRDGMMLNLDKETGKVSRKMGLDKWQPVIDVNLTGTFLMTKAVTDKMRAAAVKGRVINIASNTFFAGTPNMAAYVASKGGVIGFTRAAATELGKHGITVNALTPGLIESDGVKSSPHANAFDFVGMLQALPGRGQPEDIADAVAFLASDDARWMTGQTLNVDAGMVRY